MYTFAHDLCGDDDATGRADRQAGWLAEVGRIESTTNWEVMNCKFPLCGDDDWAGQAGKQSGWLASKLAEGGRI